MRIRPASPDDVDAVANLLAARDRAAVGAAEVTREDLAGWWRADASADRFVADADGVVGYGALDASQAFEIAARQAPVGDALLEAILERARARGFTGLHAAVVHGDAPFEALVRRSDFAHEGDVLRMWRALTGDLPDPRWADGVSVRTYEPADGTAVKTLLDDAYTAWDDTYAPRTQDDWERFMTAHDEFDPGLWFLAERGGELVACGLHWREHERRGWVKDLVVRQSERGRGLGKALLHHAFRVYAGRGVERVGLKVDSRNPTGAPQLYERVGFVTDRRFGTWVRAL